MQVAEQNIFNIFPISVKYRKIWQSFDGAGVKKWNIFRGFYENVVQEGALVAKRAAIRYTIYNSGQTAGNSSKKRDPHDRKMEHYHPGAVG